MMGGRFKRVKAEIIDCKADKAANITLVLVDDSPFHLKGSFPGPIDTPYEDGTFEVDVEVPENYPFKPFKMKFITKVYHPNVCPTSGTISLDILTESFWSPVLTLRTTLISVQALLSAPEPDDPLDAQVAEHYKASKQSFDETARYWTQVYARGSFHEIALAGLDRAHVKQFEELGFDRSKVIEVLRRLNYRGRNVATISEDQVIEELLTP